MAMQAAHDTQPSRRAASPHEELDATRHFAVGLGRAVGGALIFSLPLLMTMEMWWLGFSMDRLRLSLLLAASLPVLVGLSHVSGFEDTFELVQDVVDALVAYAVGFLTSAVALTLFGVLAPGMSLDEIVGKLALLAVPAGMGALLAQSQFGGEAGKRRERSGEGFGYWWQLFLMGVGALFLAFNIAPTEEVSLIAYRMSRWHVAALAALSVVTMHAFVYAVEFRGQEQVPKGTPSWSIFVRYTVAGYALALLTSAGVLWAFGRLDLTGPVETVTAILVLGFPAAVGAAAARLIL